MWKKWRLGSDGDYYRDTGKFHEVLQYFFSPETVAHAWSCDFVSRWLMDVQLAGNTTHECGSADGKRPVGDSPVQVISDHRAAPHRARTTTPSPLARQLWNHRRLPTTDDHQDEYSRYTTGDSAFTPYTVLLLFLSGVAKSVDHGRLTTRKPSESQYVNILV